MSAQPAPQPEPAPSQRRATSHLPHADRFLRLLHLFSAWWSPPVRQRLLGYVLALLVSGVAALITLLLVWRFPALNLEGVLFLVGIVAVALTWGMGPSLLATCVSTWLLVGVVVSPHFSWQLQNSDTWVDGMVLLLGGVGTSLLARQHARACQKAEALAAQLSEAHTSHDLERLRLRALVDSLPAPVALVDAQERVLEFNPAVQTFWREASPPRKLADFEKANAWWTATGQPVTPRAWPIARAVLTGERVITEEIEIETPDGQRRIVLDSATPIRDERGVIHGAVGVFQDITERKQLETALRQAKQETEARARELEAIFETLADGLLVYDTQGRILRSNPAAQGIFGWTAQPGCAALPMDVRHARYVPIDAQGQPLPRDAFPLPHMLHGEVFTGARTVDARVDALDGVERIVNLAGMPLRNAEGEVVGAVGLVRDVTEQRRLARQVAEHAAQLEAIFESIADGIVVTDRQERVLHMNRAARTLVGVKNDPTGWTPLQLAERAGFAIYDEQGKTVPEAETTFTHYLRGEVLTNEQSGDLLLHTRDGRQRRLDFTGAPIRDVTGQIIGSVEVLRDVTERRRLEQQTREVLEALLAMAEALVQAPETGATATASGGLKPNHVARRLAELTRRMLGCQYVGIAAVEPGTGEMTPITLVGVFQEPAQQWWASWDEHSRLGQHLPAFEVAALRAGEPVLVPSVQTPLPRGRDLVPGRPSVLVPMRMRDSLVGILRVEGETTEEASYRPNRQMLISAVARLGALVLERERLLRERAEAQANELALRTANAQMDTFLGMVGHELKTPLTSLKLALQLAARRSQQGTKRTADEAREVVPLLELPTRALLQADRLDRLINDLLDVSRVRAGKLEFHLDAVDLAAMVREALDEQRQANPGRALLLQFSADLSVPVFADADRIGQVVTNYLTNALKYSPADCPVEVGLDVEEQQAMVWVRDEGPGIAPEEQARIWDRFHRVTGIRVQSGTGVGLGLGLHICQTIIERHQGQVGVESRPGQGSTFWFTLPLGSEK